MQMMELMNFATETGTDQTSEIEEVILTELLVKQLDEDKAEDIKVIDIRGKSSIADAMIIASARSSRHLSALSSQLLRRLKEKSVKNVTVEGEGGGDWILLDLGDVIIHLFRPEVREFYQLEKFWEADLSPGSAKLQPAS